MAEAQIQPGFLETLATPRTYEQAEQAAGQQEVFAQAQLTPMQGIRYQALQEEKRYGGALREISRGARALISEATGTDLRTPDEKHRDNMVAATNEIKQGVAQLAIQGQQVDPLIVHDLAARVFASRGLTGPLSRTLQSKEAYQTSMAARAPKPVETWRAPTEEERAKYNLVPDQPYRVSEQTGEIKSIGGGGVNVNIGTKDIAKTADNLYKTGAYASYENAMRASDEFHTTGNLPPADYTSEDAIIRKRLLDTTDGITGMEKANQLYIRADEIIETADRIEENLELIDTGYLQNNPIVEAARRTLNALTNKKSPEAIALEQIIADTDKLATIKIMDVAAVAGTKAVDAASEAERISNAFLSRQFNKKVIKQQLRDLKKRAREAQNQYEDIRNRAETNLDIDWIGTPLGYGEVEPEQPQMSDEDRQALEWAEANPNDPRAQQILDRIGGQ